MGWYCSEGLEVKISCIDWSGQTYQLEQENEGRKIVYLDMRPGWLQVTFEDGDGEESQLIPDRLVRSVKFRHPAKQVAA